MLGAAPRTRRAPGGDGQRDRGMSRVEGLAEIVLWVADMESALEFYRGRFGCELISPPGLPNKFLQVAKPGGIPEMIVLIPHPHADDFFPTHKEKERRVLHHLAFRVSRRAYDELETAFIEAGIEVRHGVHPVLKGVRTFYVDDPDGNEVEVIGPA
jgi:catechol 2,3-dioxygenase-like lactoylglutathione lyase family enzyme